MICEIRHLTGTVDDMVQVLYKDNAQGPVTRIETYEGKMARVIREVFEYAQQNEVKS